MNEIQKEMRDMLVGCEVSSYHYEDVVGIDSAFNVIKEGVVVDNINTPKKLNIIFKEYTESELGF